jgi:hypothetical protein
MDIEALFADRDGARRDVGVDGVDGVHVEDAGATVLRYPSADFPPPPVLRLRVPVGWLAVPEPQAVVAVRRPEPVDGFHANVLVRLRRTPAHGAVGEHLRRLASLDDGPAGMEVLADEVRTDGPTPARALQVRFPGPDGLTLLARHLMVYVPATDHMAHLVSVVGTWCGGDDGAAGVEVESVVGSLRVLAPAA